MKVYYITMLFPSPAETFACNDVSALSGMGVDVSVHSLRFKRPSTRKLAEERGIEHICLSYNSVLNTLRGILSAVIRPSLSFPAAVWICRHTLRTPFHFFKSFILFPRVLQLYSEIERGNPDVVHLFWGHYPSILAYMVKKRLPDVLLSISLGAYDMGISYGGSRDIIKKADLITTFAKVNVKDLIELGAPPGKIQVIYRGIDREKYESWTGGISKIERKIATAGRLIPGKGMRDALRVFSGINKKWPDSRLVVLGDGPLMDELKQLADSMGLAKRVAFAGHVPHEIVLKELKSAEVFLFMSGYENERLPNAVKEALFCGCFTVAGDTPGIEELIPGVDYGAIVKPGDIAGAGDKIDAFFAEPGKFKGVTENARRHVVHNFDVKNEMKKLKESWDKLSAEKRI